jgi:hypothetical protein
MVTKQKLLNLITVAASMTAICFLFMVATSIAKMPNEYWVVLTLIFAIVSVFLALFYWSQPKELKPFRYIGDDPENKEIDY